MNCQHLADIQHSALPLKGKEDQISAPMKELSNPEVWKTQTLQVQGRVGYLSRYHRSEKQWGWDK